MRITLAGIGVGVAGAFLLARVLSNQLYQVSSFDPMTFSLTALMLALVSFLATFVPACRATKVDPSDACRYE
jgi:putative ABC transport system permease protein